jgi:hypothetical protein
MSNRGTSLAIAAGAGALVGFTGAAQADVITAPPSPAPFSVSASVPTGDGVVHHDTDTLTFNQFDTSLGTLTSITFSFISGALSDNAHVSVSGGEGKAGNVTTTATFTITGPGSLALFTNSPDPVTVNATCSAFSFGTPCTGNASVGSVTFVTPTIVSSGFAPFEGLGTFDLAVDLSLLVPVGTKGLTGSGAVCTANFGPPTTCSTSGDAAWSGSVSVQYTYTAADTTPVPEPGMLGVFATGLIATATLRRRRKRRA